MNAQCDWLTRRFCWIILCSLWPLVTGATSVDALTLGVGIAYTGKYQLSGLHTRSGYDLAVRAINENGGVLLNGRPHRLKLLYYNDASDPETGKRVIRKMAQDERIKLFLGPYSSTMTFAMSEVSEELGIPMIVSNGSSPKIFERGYSHVFGVMSTSDQYLEPAIDLATPIAEQARSQGRTFKIALAIENDISPLGVRAGILRLIQARGMRIIIDERLPDSLDDMHPILRQVQRSKPDLLVVSGHGKGAATAVQQIAESRVDVPMIALTHCEAGEILLRFARIAEHVLCASQWRKTLNYHDNIFGTAANFAEQYRDVYGYDPPYQAAEAAAAVLVAADALERTTEYTPQAISQALQQTDMLTFYGPIRFSQNGKNSRKKMVLTQIRNGNYQIVAPMQWANAELVYPIPSWNERGFK